MWLFDRQRRHGWGILSATVGRPLVQFALAGVVALLALSTILTLILDQTGIIEMVLFLEDTYGFEVPEIDLTPENFDTVANIADYVRQRMTLR